MLQQLEQLIPGFEISTDHLPQNQRILVEESTSCGADFVLYSLLEKYLRHDYKVVFVATANSYTHYNAVMKKLGRNLQQAVESGQVHYMDVFGAPFDYNSFDNLPLSLAVPNTFTTNAPAKLKQTSFSLVDGDMMAHDNFRNLLAKVDKQVQMLRRGAGSNNVLLLIDNYNLVANSCDSDRPELDLQEFFNHLIAASEADEHVSLVVGTNRDLFEQESLEQSLYRELKHSGSFQLVFECSRNLAGYSRDVHGQLNVIQNNSGSNRDDQTALLMPTQQVKNVKFRLHENRVDLFDHFVI